MHFATMPFRGKSIQIYFLYFYNEKSFDRNVAIYKFFFYSVFFFYYAKKTYSTPQTSISISKKEQRQQQQQQEFQISKQSHHLTADKVSTF